MIKLKLGALVDDKPVKLTVELPAAVHRDLAAYAEALASGRCGQVGRSDAGAFHGDGSGFREGAAPYCAEVSIVAGGRMTEPARQGIVT